MAAFGARNIKYLDVRKFYCGRALDINVAMLTHPQRIFHKDIFPVDIHSDTSLSHLAQMYVSNVEC